MDWLSKIDPTIIASVVAVLVGAFKHKSSKQALEYLQKTLTSALEVAIIKLTELPDAELRAREVLDQASLEALARLGIKRSKAVETLRKHMVEWALGELHRRLETIRRIREGLDQAMTNAQGALRELSKPKEPS